MTDTTECAGLLAGFADVMAGVSGDEHALSPPPIADATADRDGPTLDEASTSPAQALAARLLDRTARPSSPPPALRWELTGESGTRSIVVIDTVEIGRGDAVAAEGSNRLVTSCAHASRRHCNVSRRADGTIAIRDLGSVNGTVLVRGDDIVGVGHEHVELHDGDRIATADGLLTIATVRCYGGSA